MQPTSLSSYLTGIKEVISTSFNESWVTAEILSISSGGHRYLELVEYDGARREVAKVSAVVWKGDASIIARFETETSNKLQAGMKVLVRVAPTFHESFGFKLRIKGLDANYTLGDMEARLREIRAYLKQRGVWDLNRQLQAPKDFTRLAVIAPPDAAGLGDFRVEADRLHALGICEFTYFHAPFQGESPGDLIVDAMAKVVTAHREKAYDAVVVIRGGGDKSGLYQLNHRRLAHAVCRCPIPVFIGIGHERDKLLLDEVAHSRFATPSLVIAGIKESIVRVANEIYEDFQSLNRIAHQVLDRATHEAETLKEQLFSAADTQLRVVQEQADRGLNDLLSASELQLSKAEAMNERLMDQLQANADMVLQAILNEANQNMERLFIHASTQLDKAESQADQWATELMAANPMTILKRGYAYAQGPYGFVTRAEQATPGSSLTLTFNDGSVRATVDNQA